MPHFQERREALRRLLSRSNVANVLVTDELNVTYLTGFTGDSSYLLVCSDRELLNSLAVISKSDTPQIKQAIDLYLQSLTIAREIGYRYGEAAQLGYLGSGYDALGQTERAIETYQEALTITREIGYRYGEATHLGNIAGSYADLGQTQRAIELHKQALSIDLEIGDRYGEALDHFNLGIAFADLGRWDEAVAQLREHAVPSSHLAGFQR